MPARLKKKRRFTGLVCMKVLVKIILHNFKVKIAFVAPAAPFRVYQTVSVLFFFLKKKAFQK